MKNKCIAQIAIVLALASRTGAGPQQMSGSVSPPVLGFVPDGSSNLRPLIGVAGAAFVGPAVDLGFEFLQTAVASGQGYVLAIAGDAKRAVWLQVRGDGMAAHSLDMRECGEMDEMSGVVWERKRTRCDRQTIEGIDRIALSSTGSAAALLQGSTGRIYIFTGLSQSPVFARVIDTGGRDSVSVFAVTDDAQRVAFALSDGERGSLFLSAGHELPRPIGSLPHPSSIQFLRGSEAAIVADDMEDRIYSLSNGQLYALATAENGIAGPVALAVSTNNRRVFVANGRSGSVTILDVAGAAPVTVECHCSPKGLYPTSTDSVFRLTEFSGGPVVLFDASVEPSRMTFAPAGRLDFASLPNRLAGMK